MGTPYSTMLLLALCVLACASSLCLCEDNNLHTEYKEGLAAAVAEFTQSIYSHLATSSNQDNFVFSPLSLHSALSLLYLATKDNSTTQEQLGAAMGIINNQELVKTAYNRIIHSYRNQKSFLYGNHIWVGRNFTLDEEYEAVVKNKLDAGVSQLEFETREAVDEVNDWIGRTTNNKIKDLVDTFSEDTQMFIANALYFKEDWLAPFDEEDFKGNKLVKDFETMTGKVKVPMLWQESNKFVYGEITTSNKKLEVVTIPYKNKDFEMQIIVPDGISHFSILEDMMKQNEIRDLNTKATGFNLFKETKNTSEFQYDDVSLIFPKFVVKSKFNAVDAMKELGAREIFTTGAELDKLIAGGPITVGKIVHEAVVEVTKYGTEGSAATGIELTLFSAGFSKEILVDRPFIFIIQDRTNNIPILVGRIKNPLAGSP